MKRLFLVLLAGLFATFSLYSQSITEQIEGYVKNKDYSEAAKLIPDALSENRKNLDKIVLFGDIYMELEDYKNAVEMYKKADDIDGGEPWIMRKLGRSLSFFGKHPESIKTLKEVLSDEKDNVYNYLELANAYIKADSLSQAELLVTRAREMDKTIPDAYIVLGDLYFAQRVYELARENYENALSLDENLIDARIKLATSYYWLANKEIDSELANELFARSLKEWNVVSTKDPKNARAYFQQGKILFFSKRFANAAQALYQYIQLRPDGDLGRWYLGQCLYEVGQCDSAAPHLEIISQRMDSVKTKAKMLLARCYFDNENFTKSLELYESLKESPEFDDKDLLRMAGSAFNIGDTLKALDLYEEAIGKYPESTCSMASGVGKILVKMEFYDRAVNLFQRRLSTDACPKDDDAELYYWIGVCKFQVKRDDALKKGALDSAQAALLKSISIDTSRFNAYIYLGDVYAAIGDNKEAENTFMNVIQKADTADSKMQIQQAYAKICGMKLDQKNYVQLVKIGKDWISRIPDASISYIYVAIGYQGQSDKDNACVYYKKAMNVDPKNETAKKYYNQLGCGG